EHHMPGLDIGVRRRTLGQGEGLVHQLPRHRLGQEHPRRMTLSDRLIKVQRVPRDYHGSSSSSTSHLPHSGRSLQRLGPTRGGGSRARPSTSGDFSGELLCLLFPLSCLELYPGCLSIAAEHGRYIATQPAKVTRSEASAVMFSPRSPLKHDLARCWICSGGGRAPTPTLSMDAPRPSHRLEEGSASSVPLHMPPCQRCSARPRGANRRERAFLATARSALRRPAAR